MSSNATAATARQLTTLAKATAHGEARVSTTSQGPYSFRMVLRDLGTLSGMTTAGLIAHAIRGLDGGSRFTATWGRDRRGLLIINITDEAEREARIEEMGRAREEALTKALAEIPAQEVPETGGVIIQEEHGARYFTAEERAEAITTGDPQVQARQDAEHERWMRQVRIREARRAEARGDAPAAAAYTTETLEDWGGPAAVVVTREYDTAPSAEVLPYVLEPQALGVWEVRDRESYALLGRVRRVNESMRPGVTQWTRYVAYRADGSRVGHTDSLPGAARLLVPLSEQAQETLSKTVCWHVTTYRGETYGVAAQTADEALTLTNARLRAEEENDWPNAANPVGMWEAEPGTVLWY